MNNMNTKNIRLSRAKTTTSTTTYLYKQPRCTSGKAKLTRLTLASDANAVSSQHRKKELRRNVAVPFKIPHEASPRRGRHYSKRVFKSQTRTIHRIVTRNLIGCFFRLWPLFFSSPNKSERLRCWRCFAEARPPFWCWDHGHHWALSAHV